MKNQDSVLEYCVAKKKSHRKPQWTFKFRTPEGETLVQSAKPFASRSEAERGFISLIKSVATNQYKIEYPALEKN
jgi:uncharacterized protein YegP (UPF0339 family)